MKFDSRGALDYVVLGSALLLLPFAVQRAHAANFPIAAGASVATINSTMTSAAAASGGNTVTFAAGNYSINSPITVPCPASPLTIQGPTATYRPPASLLPSSYSYSTPYTANLNGSLSSGSGWVVSSSSCSQPITIQYLNWNGGQPSGGGGGFLEVLGVKVTVQYTWQHGNWANVSTSHNYDDLIDLEGGGSGSQFPQLSNISILWNVFGDGATDCNAIMNLLTYQGGSYVSSGGYCGALGVHVSTTNLVVQYNDMEHLEQPMKFFQGSGTQGDITHTFILNNPLIDSNDCGQWHRICLEGQQTVVQNNTTGGVFNATNNTTHDPIDPEYGMFGYSIPMCCSGYSGYSTDDNQVNCNNNTFIDNVLSPSFTGYAFEWWSTGSCSNNLMQGHWNESNGSSPQGAGTGIGWGRSSTSVRTWVASNNIGQFSVNGGQAVGQEVENPPPPPPIQTGNVSNTSIAARTSVAPTISPASGSQTFPLTVTLTDPGYTSGAGPQGHTGIWYTTDGSTPVPGAGTAKRLDSGGTFSLSTAATVKAVGMWGAYNQPPAYPSGYGFVPSSVVSTTYTSSSPCGSGTILITTYGGAVGDGTTDNTTAIQNTFNFAHTNGCSVEIPAGTFAHTGVVNATGITVFGLGSSSILKATNASTSAVEISGTAPSLSNFVILGTGSSRNTGPQQAGVWVNGASGFTVTNLLINGGSCVGIWNAGGQTGTVSNNTVENTLADSITNTNGAANITDQNNLVIHSGDDGISNNSYTTDGNTVNHITVTSNTVLNNAFARGLEVSGGSNITFSNNYIDNRSGYACIILASETSSFQTQTVNTVSVTNNTLANCGPNQGSLFFWPDGSGNIVENVTANGNRFYNGGQQTFTAVQITGAGTMSGNIVENSSAYITPGPSFFSSSFTGTGSITQTGNTTFASSAYPGPLAAPSGGTAPIFSLPSGTYTLPQSLSLNNPTAGDVINYCSTGGTSCTPGTAYSSAITISAPQTICATGVNSSSLTPVTSASICATYNGGGPVLTSVSIAPTAGQSTLLIGGTVQMIVTCQYSDGSTSGCNTADSHGNTVTNWASSNGNVTVSSSGLATGAGIGTSVITATVTGGFTTSPGSTLTVNANPLTLSSVSLATTGGVSSIQAGATNQLSATCHYSDGSSTGCTTLDNHGNAVSSANSSAPTIATVTSPGALVTGLAAGSTNLSVSVTPAPSMLGTSLENVTGFTNNGFINEIYGVTGTASGGYTPGACHITIPATSTWTAGKHWACILVLGTPTTQNASAVCSNTYTMSGSSWPGGDIVISMAGCPNLPADTGYWIGSTTDQTTSNPVQGFSNCNSSCSGAPPLFGSGTYAYRYVTNTFGSYTSLPTTLTPSGGTQQVSQYLLLTASQVGSGNLPLTVTAAPPTLVSAYLTAVGSTLVVGNTLQMAAKCRYTSGPDQDCTVADIYGDAVTAWTSSDPTKASVNNVGATSPGLVTAVAPGTPSITATIGSTTTSSPYPITVNSPAVTLTGITLSTAGGVTGLFVGATNQLKATCTYSDHSSDDCTNTDAHGNKANTWTSTSPSHATINATTGLVTGVAAGSATFTAVAGSLTSNPLPLAVFPVLSGIYTISVSGPVKFSGTVRF